jgi:hypothetical protein
MKTVLAILCAFLTAWSCQPTPTPAPVPVPPILMADAAPPPAPPPAPAPTPTPAPVPTPAPPGDAYDAACANLKALGCSSGKVVNCASSMRLVDQEHATRKPLNVACFTTAKSIAAVRVCGFVVCE